MFLGNSKLKVRKAKHALLYTFWCSGCEETHTFQVLNYPSPVPVQKNGHFGFFKQPENWTFNDNFEKPSFSPSLNYATQHKRCHLFLKDGNIEYCTDCWHQYAGQKIPLEDF